MKQIIYLLAFIGMVASPIHSDKKVVTFGVVPQQSSSTLAKAWVPILNYLSENSDLKLRFATAKNIPTFEERLKDKAYDFAYMNPYHFVVFHKQSGYQALARQKDKVIKGIIVVRKDFDLNSLSDLHGKKLAFPAPAAFAASILPRSHFNNEKIDISPKYVSSHDSVYKSVAKGLFPAGGGVVRTFNTVDEDIRNQLKIFWTTKGYTSHAIAHHPDLDEALKFSLWNAMVKMNQDPKGLELLKALNFKGFEAAKNSDWQDVKDLNIDLLK